MDGGDDEAQDAYDAIDDVLDRCRHGKTANERCELCDTAQIDLREDEAVDLTEEDASTRKRPE